MNEKKKQNQKTGKQVNVTVYDLKGKSVYTGKTSFDTRGQILRFVAQRSVPGVAAIMFNNQPVILDKGVMSKINIEHSYYLNKNLQTFDKETQQPIVVPVDVIGRLIGRDSK